MSIAELADIPLESPGTLDEACSLMARYVREDRQVWPLAGCTDWMVERHISPIGPAVRTGVAMDITRIAELKAITIQGDRAIIGATATFSAIRRHDVLSRRCALLAQMASEVGAIQIQSRGTLGGNLASGSPAADGVAALLALDADVILRSEEGERVVAVHDYFTGYRRSVRRAEELVTRFEFQLPAESASQLWRKVGTRKAQAISKFALAALAERDPNGLIMRIGFGAASIAEVVLPLDASRELILGRPASAVDLDALEAAVDAEVRPITDVRSTEAYRRHIARILVRRFIEQLHS